MSLTVPFVANDDAMNLKTQIKSGLWEAVCIAEVEVIAVDRLYL
jgi:hypothetical protein